MKRWCPEWNSMVACAQALITYSKYKHMLYPGPCGTLKDFPCPRTDDWNFFLPAALKARGFWRSHASRCGVEGAADKWRQRRRRCLTATLRRRRLSLCDVIWTRGRASNQKSISGVSERGLWVLWIIHCDLWKHNPCCLCGCNWFVYENSHCSQKCRRQPNRRAASSESHCFMNAMKPKPTDHPSLKTKPLHRVSKANRATTGFVLKILPPAAALCPARISRGLRGGWLSIIFSR